ncbi:MAG: hypothetical protein Q9172_004492 [Xanthocarpia lactea]
MVTIENEAKGSIPIILLKNSSAGHVDLYTTHFASNPPSPPNSHYEPLYVPVLEHTSNIEPLLSLLSRFNDDRVLDQDPTSRFTYGGLIFTSQRAVEAFASSLDCCRLNDDQELNRTPLEQLQRLAVPLYAVGPATARSLEGVQKTHMPCCWVRGGKEAGTGELLAELILRDYNTLCNTQTAPHEKKPLLFLTGAQHREIIPNTLMSAPDPQRINVQTMIVYATSESPSFATNITHTLLTTSTARLRWIIIFSPTGGESLLRALGWLSHPSETNSLPHQADRKTTFIATIGPTTRDYMKTTFGFSVDVCAETPSPEGVRKGIEEFMQTRVAK